MDSWFFAQFVEYAYFWMIKWMKKPNNFQDAKG